MTPGEPAVDVRAQVRAYVVDFLLAEDATLEVAFDTPLLSSGLLDSVAIEELLRFIEEEFGVEFDDEELAAENFETIEDISRLVGRKRGAA